eukprot:9475599-Ditylum_brightwellii.AAC.1
MGGMNINESKQATPSAGLNADLFGGGGNVSQYKPVTKLTKVNSTIKIKVEFSNISSDAPVSN